MRDEGYVLAEMMGLKAFRDYSGEEGTVYLLEDGRILKITDSEIEAAVCLALVELQAKALAHPSVPMIDAVMWLEDDRNDAYLDKDERRAVYYVIIRENFEDLTEFDDDHMWTDAMLSFRSAWSSERASTIANDIAEYPHYAQRLEELHDGLRWIRQQTGIRMSDARAENVGIGNAGKIGLRDLGRGMVPDHLMHRVKTLDFKQVILERAIPAYRPIL